MPSVTSNPDPGDSCTGDLLIIGPVLLITVRLGIGSQRPIIGEIWPHLGDSGAISALNYTVLVITAVF